MNQVRRVVFGVLVAAIALAACGSSDAKSDAPATAKPSSTCHGTAPAGRSEATVTSNGITRSYIRYVPKGVDATKASPLVVDLTAYSPATLEESFSSFTKPDADGVVKADAVGAVVVTPEPVNGKGLLTWNVNHTAGWTEDERFIADLVKDVETKSCIDPRRVYAMGFAIGAVMASTLACDQPQTFAAIATVSGLWDPPACAPTRRVPVISFHGTDDHFLPYDGGVGDRIGMLGLTPETTAGLTAMATRPGELAATSTWAARNGCATTPHDTTVSETITRRTWSGCDADVELYTIAGAGHTWPGSNGMGAYEALLGPVSHAINANDLIWTFFTHQTT